MRELAIQQRSHDLSVNTSSGYRCSVPSYIVACGICCLTLQRDMCCLLICFLANSVAVHHVVHKV